MSYGKNWERDQNSYQAIRLLGSYVNSRNQELPTYDEAAYNADWVAINE